MRKRVLSVSLSFCIAAGSILCTAGDTAVYAAQEAWEEQETGSGQAAVQEGLAEYAEAAAPEEVPQENAAQEIRAAEAGQEKDIEEARAKESQDWEWDVLEDGTVSIRSYSGTETEVEIPSALDGKKVTALGYFAFNGNSEITNIKIPDTVTTLADSVFSCCTGLKEIAISKNVSSIGGKYSLTVTVLQISLWIRIIKLICHKKEYCLTRPKRN